MFLITYEINNIAWLCINSTISNVIVIEIENASQVAPIPKFLHSLALHGELSDYNSINIFINIFPFTLMFRRLLFEECIYIHT